MSRRILVTGGYGYVGGRVAQALAAQPGVEVRLGSRSPQRRPAWLPSAIPVLTPWQDFGALRRACAGADSVIHLAAMNEIEAARDPVGALVMNGVATARLMEAAKAEQVGSFIYFSTAHVYGAPLAGCIDESVCPRPVHPYATSHRAAEDVVLAAHAAGVMAGIVVRLSNSFGAPAHPGVNRWTLLANDLCRQAATTGKLVLNSSGLQRRDFVTLADVGRAVSHLEGLPREALGDGIFNVGGAWAPSVMEMATLVAERCDAVLGFRPQIVRPEPTVGETAQSMNYRIDRLMASGFALEGSREAEIDATLLLCHRAFGVERGDK